MNNELNGTDISPTKNRSRNPLIGMRRLWEQRMQPETMQIPESTPSQEAEDIQWCHRLVGTPDESLRCALTYLHSGIFEEVYLLGRNHSPEYYPVSEIKRAARDAVKTKFVGEGHILYAGYNNLKLDKEYRQRGFWNNGLWEFFDENPHLQPHEKFRLTAIYRDLYHMAKLQYHLQFGGNGIPQLLNSEQPYCFPGLLLFLFGSLRNPCEVQQLMAQDNYQQLAHMLLTLEISESKPYEQPRYYAEKGSLQAYSEYGIHELAYRRRANHTYHGYESVYSKLLSGLYDRKTYWQTQLLGIEIQEQHDYLYDPEYKLQVLNWLENNGIIENWFNQLGIPDPNQIYGVKGSRSFKSLARALRRSSAGTSDREQIIRRSHQQADYAYEALAQLGLNLDDIINSRRFTDELLYPHINTLLAQIDPDTDPEIAYQSCDDQIRFRYLIPNNQFDRIVRRINIVQAKRNNTEIHLLTKENRGPISDTQLDTDTMLDFTIDPTGTIAGYHYDHGFASLRLLTTLHVPKRFPNTNDPNNNRAFRIEVQLLPKDIHLQHRIDYAVARTGGDYA